MHRILFPLVFFLLALSSQAFAWQQVQVEVVLEDDKSSQEMEQKALRHGFSRAVLQEVSGILPGELDEKRQEALGSHLDWRVNDLILGYRIFSREETDDSMVMTLEVNVDGSTLRNILKRLGAYYTITEYWEYDLSTQGANPEDFHLLQRLQLITGAKVNSQAPTSLVLRRISPAEWSGTIEYEGISHRVSGGDLSRVWFDLWSYFFATSKIKSMLTSDLILKTSGWATTDAVMHFNNTLLSWDKEVESGNILYVYNDVPSVRVVWGLTTFNQQSLELRLESHLAAKRIYYTLDDNHQKD